MFRKTFCVMLFAVLCGCSQRNTTQDKDHVICVLIDLSDSFKHMMIENGKAHSFLMQILDRYYRDQVGTDSQIVIAQISGSDRSLLWKGTPAALRHEFSSGLAFRQFLKKKAQPGSRVYESIAQTADYLGNDPAVASGKAKSTLFVLSDLIDNAPDAEGTKKRAIAALTKFGQAGGNAGFYYVDQGILELWRTSVNSTGMKYVIEADFVWPALPSFE